MNETRKAIISIIEPYMEKDLSEGCLVEYEWLLSKYDEYQWVYKIVANIWTGFEIYREWTISFTVLLEEIKIIWHYDVTAVLKFVQTQWYRQEIQLWWKELIIFNQPDWEFIEFQEHIPNKPLSLYTENQEKDLLQLLNKLWKTNK